MSAIFRIGFATIDLREREAAILRALARTPGECVEKFDLIAAVFPGGQRKCAYQLMVSALYSLRAKLKFAGYPEAIQTVFGRGYMLSVPDPVSAATPEAGAGQETPVGVSGFLPDGTCSRRAERTPAAVFSGTEA